MADIFVSYTASDRDWAFWIGQELEELGHAPRIHEWEVKSGEDIYSWMESRHDAADHVLCVVSDDYLTAPYSTLERNAALWQAAAARPGFVLFVAVKPCRLPTLLDHYRRCELFGVADDVARARFREFMAVREAAPVAFPGQAFAVSNIPIRVPEHFLGRDDSLAAIESALARYEGRVAITALHGLRGVGKTTLAAVYAERHRGDYRATWWIRAQTPDGMRADLVALGVRLNWVAADEEEEPAFAAVMERLRNEGAGLLLIYDNAIDAEALRPYLPRGGASRVLVTSNAHTWRGVAQPVEIRLWPKEIGANYLVARTGRESERTAAEALSFALGGLPLAHEQAAAYCERLDMPLAEYQRRFDAMPAKFLDDARHAPAEYHDGLTVAKTFALAIEKAAKLHPAAEPLIVHCALLAPEPVPLYLFSEAREKLGEPLASALRDDGVIEAVAALRAFALVDRETIPDERNPAIVTDCIRVHRLVRQIAALRREGGARDRAWNALVAAVAAIFPEQAQDQRFWPRARRLDAIALALANDEAMSARATPDLATVLVGLGSYRSGQRAHAQAQAFDERALAIREAVLGPEHPDTALSLNNLAMARANKGDFEAAQRLCERALAIREKAFGPESDVTAYSLNNLGYLLQEQGDLAGARPLYQRALGIYEKVLGPEGAETAQTLYHLGYLLLEQGDLKSARPLLERALAIREKVFGPEHSKTAQSVNGLARVLQEQGDFGAARTLYERALAIREALYGPDSEDATTALNNLAVMLFKQGDYAAARPLFERALASSERAHGAEHFETAISLNNLATLLRRQREFAAARPLTERALAINEKALGPDHPNTANCMFSLASLLLDLGQPGEAGPLFRRAIASSEAKLGNDNPQTQRFKAGYATLLLACGEVAEALSVAQAALAVHAAAFGAGHPYTTASASVTADALDALTRGSEAKLVREKYGIAAEPAGTAG